MQDTCCCSIWVAGLVVFAAAVVGCGPEKISEEEARSYVADWAAQAEESLEDQVGVAAADEQFQKLAEKAAKRESEGVQRDEPPYAKLVRDAYASAGWNLRFAGREGLTDRGESVWSVVSEVDRHAIDTAGFKFDSIRKRLEEIRKLSEEVDSVSAYEPSDREKARAREWLTGKKKAEFDLESANYETLAKALSETSAGEELRERMSKLEKLVADRANSMAQLELLLAHDTARYARKMKHFRVRHLFIHEREDDYWRDPVTEGERPDEAKGPYVAGIVRRRAAKIADKMKEPTEILHRRIRRTVKGTLTEENPADVLRNLEPQNPQYAALEKAYEKYRSIVEEGGWSEVSEESYLDPGDSGETVAALKKRLQTEGYFPEDASIDETYGEDLEAAIESYQKTHQMEVTGEPHDSFWSSLNKSAEWRKQQLGLNLQRWRESDIRHSDPLYVLVNIPGAHLEVWKDQERTMRFRVVVGNNKSDYDREKQKTVHPNQTPEVSAYIDRVIYNPYWNITDRIRKTEILPKARKSVEQTYRAKLKELRRKKKRLESELASEDEASSEESEEGSKLPEPGDSSGDQLLVARSTESEEQGTRGDAESEAPPEQAESDGDSNEDTASESSSAEEESVADADTDGESEESSSNEDEKNESSESVDISDLYRMVEDEQSRVEEVDMKTVFEVDEIRRLIEETNRLEARKNGGEDEGSGEESAGVDSASTGSSSDGSEESGGGDDEESKSPLEQKFPYLDLETGMVDISTTDPDNVPAWYENNDYEVMFPGKKWEYVRMKQGRQNALGRVKVIFPNRHDIYLHDTPKKQLFERNVRAFSHGCMRMDEPLSFAEYLLKQDGSLGEVDVDELLNEKKRARAEEDSDRKWKRTYEYRPVFLDREIPVYVEYFTTRVDEKGRTHFFADIYDRDAEALDRDGD